MNTLNRNQYWWRIGVILVIGTVMTVFAFQIARILEDQRIARELEIGAVDRVATIQRAINEQLRLLESVAAFWTVSERTRHTEFRAFVAPFFRRNPQLTAIGWAPMVPADNRLAVEEATRREELTDFGFTERDPDGNLIPAAERDYYVPVLYIEPIAGNEPAIGFDLYSESNRRAVLDATRDTGTPHTTRSLHLVQEQRPRQGLLSALAIYRRGAVLDTVQDRRQALRGFVTEVYWIDEVINAGLSSLLPGGIDIYFLDPAEGVDAPPIFIHSSRMRGRDSAPEWSPQLLANPAGYRGRLDVGGREWAVVCLPAPGFVAAQRGPLPWTLLAIGALATLLGVINFGIAERRSNKLRQAHADLQASETRLRNVVENMPVLMSALDEDGTIITWNKECERVIGYSADEVRSQPALLERLYPEASRRDSAEQYSPHDYLGQEQTLVAKNGTNRTISWSNLSRAIPIPGWDSWYIGIDVTDRNRADREKLEMQKQLLQGQKLESLGLLAGGVAHDFNNLLTVILGNASLARQSILATDPAHSALGGVIDASERAALLTQQLLAYTGRGTRETRAIDLSEHALEIGKLLRAAIPKKVALNFNLAEDLPPVNADPAQMQQLIMNLVINGAEAAGDQPGTVTVHTGMQDIDASYVESLNVSGKLQAGAYVYLEVQDSGHGMDAETQARIFDPFFSTKFTGRGLGLAAAIGIVRSHNGSIEVKSTPGFGSLFKVLLPASGEMAYRRPDTREENLRGNGLILVVDDEPMIRQLATRTLTELGYDVLAAEDGLAAIEIFRKRRNEIDCVLLDLTMPNLDGKETLTALRELRSDVIAILSSGYDKTDATDRLEGDSAAGFLHKPYTPNELGTKIKRVLKTRRRRHSVA